MPFMVMQGMHQLEEWMAPRSDSKPAGTSTSHSQRSEDRHGKVQVAMSGTKSHALTGVVAPVQAGRLRSLLSAAHSPPEVIVIILRGFTTSTSG